MFRERDTRQFVANHCQCQMQQQTKPKSTIKQFIQLDSIRNRNDSFHKRNSRIIELIDTSNRNLASLGVPTPKSNITLKYPLHKTRSTSIYNSFPVTENLYDEINPLEEELTSTYDHLSLPYVSNEPSTYQRLNKPNCFRLNDNNYNSQKITKVNSIRKYHAEPRETIPPPPPPIKRLPRINRANLNQSLNSSNRSTISRLNKSFTSAELQAEQQYDKWTHDNSSGYNSSQDLSNNTSSSNSSITSYCSITESLNKHILVDKTNMIDSGISTIDDDNLYDCTENLSSYSNISPSSISSFNSSFSEQDIQSFTSPFPRIKTSMVAQIKRINPVSRQTKTNELVYENLRNQNLEKAYSVKDVLFSLKKMELNNKNTSITRPDIQFSPITANSRVVNKPTTNQYLNIQSTPPRHHNHRDFDDFLCDEEVESILSPKKACEQYSKQHVAMNPSSVYKYSNKRNVAIWEQLV